jgi:hypothetical protein
MNVFLMIGLAITLLGAGFLIVFYAIGDHTENLEAMRDRLTRVESEIIDARHNAIILEMRVVDLEAWKMARLLLESALAKEQAENNGTH